MKLKMSMILAACLAISSAYAEDVQMQYQQRQLPDGSTETEYSSSDGSKMTQIRKPDGTVEIKATDAQGNQTTTTQHPGGNMDVKTKSPEPAPGTSP